MPENQFISTEQLIGRALDAGVELGPNPHQAIENYIQQGLVPPRLINGLHASAVLDRLIGVDKLLKEGNSIEEIKDIIAKQRRSFLSRVTDLNSMANLYKSSSKSLLMLASIATLILFSFTVITKTPGAFAKVATENGAFIAKQAAKPAGIALASVIKAAKSEDSNSTDPLGLTNIDKVITINEQDQIVIEKTIVAATNPVDSSSSQANGFLLLNEEGNLQLAGNIEIEGFFVGDGSGLTDLNLPTTLLYSDQTYADPTWLSTLSWAKLVNRPGLLTSLDGVSNDLGDINLIAGSGVTITSDDANNTITLNIAGSGVNADLLDSLDSSQFLRSDTSDSFTSGTLTLNAGTTLDVLGAFTCTNCVSDAAVVNTITASNYLPLTGGVLSGALTVSGVTGLIDADIPDTITASNYLLLAGGTMSGNIDFANNLALNLGAAGTDFTAGGGLNIATDLDVNGHLALGSSATINTAWIAFLSETISSGIGRGMRVTPTFTGTTGTTAWGIDISAISNPTAPDVQNTLTGLTASVQKSGTGGLTNLTGINITRFINPGSGAVSNSTGILISSPSYNVMPTTTYGLRVMNQSGTGYDNTYAIHVENQTGGTNAYGLAIDGADTQLLWLSSAADNTDAVNGIAFGLSRDTNLYRSGASNLRTDDTFSIIGTIRGGLIVNITNTCCDVGSDIGADITVSSVADFIYGVRVNLTSNFAAANDVFGVHVTVAGNNSFALDRATGVYISNPVSIGSIWNKTGLRIAAISGGTSSNYAIYSEGGHSYHEGNLYIGRVNAGNDSLYGLVVEGSICVDDTTANCPAGPTSGAIYVENSVGAGNVSAFDISEYYPASEDVEKGDVVVADRDLTATVRRSSEPYQPTLIGIVATDPAIVINENDITFGKTAGDEFNPRKPYVALAGRVPVKVSSENGSIAPGDPITSSTIAGVGMKATKTGPIIGRALESFSGAEVGKILVFVQGGYFSKEAASSVSDLNPVKLAADSRFSWTNQLGNSVAWVNDLGESFFTKVTAGIGRFQTLVFGELRVSQGSKSAGEANLRDGESEVFVPSEKVNSASLINLTPTSEPEGIIYLKERRSGEGFVVGVRELGERSQDIHFTWFILNQE